MLTPTTSAAGHRSDHQVGAVAQAAGDVEHDGGRAHAACPGGIQMAADQGGAGLRQVLRVAAPIAHIVVTGGAVERSNGPAEDGFVVAFGELGRGQPGFHATFL